MEQGAEVQSIARVLAAAAVLYDVDWHEVAREAGMPLDQVVRARDMAYELAGEDEGGG